MMSYYTLQDQQLTPSDQSKDFLWLDLVSPDADERSAIEKKMGLSLPSLEDMNDIEVSSRLYEEDDAIFMTLTYVFDALEKHPKTIPITFILKNQKLITLRYHHSKLFDHFIQKAGAKKLSSLSHDFILINLLENINDWYSDVLEHIQSILEKINHDLFNENKPTQKYNLLLSKIAKQGQLNSKIHESLVSLERLCAYFKAVVKTNDENNAKIQMIMTDTRALIDHTNFISNKISFTLDATLGMVAIEQNSIIKIFSVAAVIFLPPTLIATIYGMNFRHMPELEQPLAYPIVLILMLFSAIAPYLYFKYKKWL